jgi:alpha-acetolactate decarboxylase
MSEAVLVALITGGLSLAGVIITCIVSNQNIEKKLEIAQAVTDTKLEELTREVRQHNNFAQRMPVVENEIKHINGEIKSIEKDIHKYHG